MFHRNNLNKKNFAAANADNKIAADGWECPKVVSDIQWALANLAEVYAQLWPLDGSIRVLQRILIRYEFGAGYGSSEKERCRIVEDFVDKILCENAVRAARGAPYLPFETVKNRWRDAVEKEPRAKGADNTHQQQSNSNAQHNNRTPNSAQRGGTGASSSGRGANRGAIRGRSGWQARTAVATYQGSPVCFHYNIRPPPGQQSTCTRPAMGNGCDNGRGGMFAHVCNFNSGGANFCLQPHPRYANH